MHRLRAAFASLPALGCFGTAILFAATTALAQPGMGPQTKLFKIGGPDELWDVTMKMEMPGMPMAMPAQTHQMCLKKDRKGEDAIPKQENCRTTDVRTVGNKVTFAMECTGKDPMTGRGEITSTPTAYDGRMQVKSTRRGEEMEMTQTFSGKKVGACTDESEKVVANAKAAGDAQLATICRQGIDSLQYELFAGRDAACASQRKPFCDKVIGLGRDMREPAAFKAVVAKSSMDYVQGSFRTCNVNLAETSKAACGKGLSSKDWAFVGSGNCDDEVRTAAPTYCQGRDYYLVDKSLTSLCNRYARLTRGPGAATTGGEPGAPGAAPAGGKAGAPQAPMQGSTTQNATAQGTNTQTAPPAAPKADPVQQGVETLRKLLPF
jgi:hypothetical protein